MINALIFVCLLLLPAIIEIQSQPEIVYEVRKVFKNESRPKSHRLTYCISDTLTFIDIQPLIKSSIYIDKSGLDAEIFEKTGGFRQKNWFEPTYEPSLNSTLCREDPKLHVNFSKRFGNVLAAEISNKKFSRRSTPLKLGQSIIVLFYFDEFNKIHETEIRTLVHN
ncbi:MAG: hypothetical protein IPL46_30355 [Saprospiraceae bacterium]|nr:hypothetical protein [Saprospiraceae bacterium]